MIITSNYDKAPSLKTYNHTREMLPATIYSKSFKKPKKLNDFQGLGTLGNIITRNFGLDLVQTGEDRFDELI